MSKAREDLMKENFPLKVYFLDNSYKILMIPNATKCEKVVQMVASKLGFQNLEDDSYWFSLYESLDGASLNRALPKDVEIKSVVDAFDAKGPSKIVFKIKIFLESLTKSKCPVVRYMRYIQAVYDVNCGNYFIANDMHQTCVKLACLQFVAKFGPDQFYEYGEEEFKSFLFSREIEYFPKEHRDNGRERAESESNAKDMYAELLNMKKSGPKLSKFDAVSAYLKVVSAFTCYGCTFFPIQQYNFQQPQDVRLGVHGKGFMLFNVGSQDFFHIYQLQECLRWGYVPTSTFYISTKADNGKNIIFATSFGPQICDVMTSYAYGWLKHASLLKAKFKKQASAVDLIRESNTRKAGEAPEDDEIATEASTPKPQEAAVVASEQVEVQIEQAQVELPTDAPQPEKEMIISQEIRNAEVAEELEDIEEGEEDEEGGVEVEVLAEQDAVAEKLAEVQIVDGAGEQQRMDDVQIA